MAYPKIVYIPDEGNDAGETITLAFSFPPVSKSAGHLAHEKKSDREDTISLSGLKQSWHFHTDEFLTLQMDFVPLEDIVDWEAFLDFALAGGSFDYYQDADEPEFVTYTLDDKDWAAKFSARGLQKFSLKLRKEVADDLGS